MCLKFALMRTRGKNQWQIASSRKGARGDARTEQVHGRTIRSVVRREGLKGAWYFPIVQNTGQGVSGQGMSSLPAVVNVLHVVVDRGPRVGRGSEGWLERGAKIRTASNKRESFPCFSKGGSFTCFCSLSVRCI